MSLVAKLRALRKQTEDTDLRTAIDALITDAEGEDALLSEASKSADQAKASYTGLQTTHQRAVEAAKATDAVLVQAQSDLVAAKSEAASAAKQVQTVTDQLTTANAAIEGGKSELANTVGRLAMYDLITDTYPALQPMRSTLQPLGTAAETAEMLERVHASVASAVEATVVARMQGYVPDVNFRGTGGNNGAGGRQNPLSPDALLADALKKAGTSEFDAAIGSYYTALEAAGQMPAVPAPRVNGFMAQSQVEVL